MNHLRRLTALLLAAVLLFCTLFPVSAAETAEDIAAPEQTVCSVSYRLPLASRSDTFRILLIGNSFSVDTSQWFYDIAAQAGYSVLVGNLNLSSCTLEDHWNYAKNDTPAYTYRENDSGTWRSYTETTMSYALQKQNWDIVFFQQQTIAAGKSSRTRTGLLTNLAAYARENCASPDLKLGYEMSWAVAESCDEADYHNNFKDQLDLYNGICRTTRTIVEPTGVFDLVAATGTAVQNARSGYFGDSINRDMKHLTKNFGRVLAGMSLASACGIDLSNVSAVADIGTGLYCRQHLDRFRTYISDAEAAPYSVTQQDAEPPALTIPEVKVVKDGTGANLSWSVGDVNGYTLHHQAVSCDSAPTEDTFTCTDGVYRAAFDTDKNTVYTYTLDVLGDSYIPAQTVTGSFAYIVKTRMTVCSTMNDGALRLRWKLRDGVPGYHLQYSTDPAFRTDRHNQVLKDNLGFITDLKPNTTYYVRVRSRIKKNGLKYYSRWSDVILYKTGRWVA